MSQPSIFDSEIALPSDVLAGREKRLLGFEARYTRDADAQSPAGGVSSSANDMARWLMMNLADGKVGTQTVIDPDALRESHTAQIATGPLQSSDARSRFYGYGFNVENTSTGHVRLGHSGAFYVGAGTAFAGLVRFMFAAVRSGSIPDAPTRTR